MEKKIKLFFTFIFVILLIGGLYFFTDWFSKVTGYFGGESEQEKLAHCLDGKGAQFYGSLYCADCEKQKEIFGRAFDSIDQIECGKDKEFCSNIREIPAWYINRTIYYGLKNESELKEVSGCVD